MGKKRVTTDVTVLDFVPAEEIIYIAGPMRGVPEYNRRAFEFAASRFRKMGFKVVISPIEQDDEKWGGPERAATNFDLTLGFDLNVLCTRATILALLPGWERSLGAQLELRVALTCIPPKRIVYAGTLEDIPPLVLRSYRPGKPLSTSGTSYEIARSDDITTYSGGARRSTSKGKCRPDLISVVLKSRLGWWLSRGCDVEEYGERNWEKGIPLSRWMAGIEGHLLSVQMGAEDGEDHEAALAFNIMGWMHTREMIRRSLLPAELDDWPKVEKSNE